MSDYPTTRRHPRSLSEAFPDERAAAIEGPVPRVDTLLGIALAIVLGIAGAFLMADFFFGG